MAEFLTSTDGATFDDRIQRFEYREFEGWAYTDNTQVLGPRRRSRSRGAFRTPNKIDGAIDFTNPKMDASTDFFNATRRSGTSLLGIVYNEASGSRDFLAGEWGFEDVPETYGDELTTALTALPQTPHLEPLPFSTTADSFIPNSEWTSGTAESIGTVAATLGPPVIVMDFSHVESLGSAPSIEVELAITGATGSPWSVTARGTVREGIYIVDFGVAPEDFTVHPNVAHATAADAEQIAAATTAAATTIEITLNNFSGTRTDTVFDVYVARRMRRN